VLNRKTKSNLHATSHIQNRKQILRKKMEIKELAKAFGKRQIPEILVELLNFVNTVSKDNWFSEGFEFSIDEEKYGLKTYSKESEFLYSLIEFAKADGTGSTYAIWIKNNDESLENMPIVTFGSEGGYHIVSENIKRLLEILSYDVEPMIDWDAVDYYKDEDDYEASENIEAYRKWLAENYQIEATNNADKIVEIAQEKHQKEFEFWMEKYYSE